MSESEWITNRIAELVSEHGAVPPPWFMFPDTHPYDICWRMGAGEFHVMVFHAWWEEQKQNYDEAQRIEYFRKWLPPPRWLTWMIDVIWDINLSEVDNPEEYDYSSYFARTEELGFGTQAEFERDMDDPTWLEDN
ncbi:MAG: hypothetical protein MJA27_27145 [Pseudanabaenales cyanobacterium]|nr:hypothetical protein [Pseudanabaenales cyanobacterium]